MSNKSAILWKKKVCAVNRLYLYFGFSHPGYSFNYEVLRCSPKEVNLSGMRIAHILSIVIVLLLSACSFNSKNITVASLNIRSIDNPDSLNSWRERKPLVKEFLKKGKYDIISFQEVLKPQLDYLTNVLHGYSVVSAGRRNGVDVGEHCSIFFRTSKFDLLAKSYFWLSGNPEEPGSIDWGANLPRMVTWAKLQNKRTGHIFFVFNTHLSHREYAQDRSVLLLLSKIKLIADNVPVIITGDFNFEPGSQPYRLMTGNWHNYFSFSDAYKISNSPASENENTYNGFWAKEGTKRIDYVFVNGYLDVQAFRTVKLEKNGLFISDHYPVVAELKFNIDRLERNGKNKPLPKFAPRPVFETNRIVFEDSLIVPVRSDLLKASVYYTLDGTLPNVNSKKYLSPIILKETTLVKAVTVADGFLTSACSHRTFIKSKCGNIKLVSIHPGTVKSLISENCNWLFDGKILNEQIQNTECVNVMKSDVDLVLKLKKTQDVDEVFVSMLEDHNLCVYPPKRISVSTSLNGKNFSGHDEIVIKDPFARREGRVHSLRRIKVSRKARYIKIKIENPGSCPKEYAPEGEPTRLIIDEIGVL